MATIQLNSCINDLKQNTMAGKTLAGPCSSRRTNKSLRKSAFWHSELWHTAANGQEHVSKLGQLKRPSKFAIVGTPLDHLASQLYPQVSYV